MVQPALSLDDSPPIRIVTTAEVLRPGPGNTSPKLVLEAGRLAQRCHAQGCHAILIGYRKHAKYCRGSRCRTQASRDRQRVRDEAEAEEAELARFMLAASCLGAVSKADLEGLLTMGPWELRTAIRQIVKVRVS